MSGKYDIEAAIADIVSYLQSNLNAQITAVSTDKGDGVSLPLIDANAYFVHGLDEKALTFDPFVVIAIDDVKSVGEGPMTSKKYDVHAVIVLANRQDGLTLPRMLRYQRALEELFEAGWDKIRIGNKLKVQSLVPIALRLFDSSSDYRAVGLSLEVNLA